MLLVSPERLNNPDFRDQVLPALAADAGLVVVDEAHCVSDWGHDFRPDYRRIRTLLAELRRGRPVLATTATANARVIADVAEQLGVGGGDTLVLRGALDRESLRLSVVRLPTPAAPRGLARRAPRTGCPAPASSTRSPSPQADDVAALLRDAGARGRRLHRPDRGRRTRAAEADLLDNRVKALVATSALGMGFDKPDLGFVVHLGAPSSPIAYYQQVGRAGRATDSAEVVLLPGREDQADLALLRLAGLPAGGAGAPGARRARPGPAAVDRRRWSRWWTSTAPGWRWCSRCSTWTARCGGCGAAGSAPGSRGPTTAERYRSSPRPAHAEQQAMLDYQRTAECRMEFLRRQLDDPSSRDRSRAAGATTAPAPAYDADGGRRRGRGHPGAARAPRRRARAAQAVADRAGEARRRRCPARSPTDPQPGRVIGRLTDLGWGSPAARAARRPGRGPVPDEVVAAAVDVLAAWDWATAADRGDGAGFGQPPAADRVARGPAGRGGPAEQPWHAAVFAASTGR